MLMKKMVRIFSGEQCNCSIQTAEYVRFRRDLGGGKFKNLGAGAQTCTTGGLRVIVYHVLLCHV